ncbi:MAG: single-stranded DNA-binding protein [Propionibacteriaceae bacterium]|nr:single-stranded DNA-binding protein [Propionibacteriaceae bacterium]
MEAQVWMTGRVGSEVEYRPVNSNVAFANFRMACTPRILRSGEWGDADTTWVGVSCSRALAEHVKCSLTKGDPVVVVGRLRTKRWVDGNGVEHEQLTIEASSVGHDLTHGTAKYHRVRRAPEPPGRVEPVDADPESDDGDEELRDLERQETLAG